MKTKVVSTVLTGAFALVVTLILFFVNVIVAQLPPLRIDLTSTHQYGLSEATHKVVGRLADRLKIEAYFTRDLPAPYNGHAAYLRDMLEEYAAYAHGNLTFEFIDPGTDEARKREIMMKGIAPLQIQEVRDDQIGIKQGFMGLVITYGTRKETIPVVRDVENLEYELTSVIKKLTASELRTVAFTAGHGEIAPQEKMQRLRAELSKNYGVVSHDFATAKEIPSNISTLVIVGPTEKWSDEHLFALDQFLMKGGTVAFLLDDVKVDFHKLSEAKDMDHGLYDILAFWGVKPEQDLIVDPHCSHINLEAQQGPIRMRNTVKYPYISAVTNLNREHILTKDVGTLSLPFLSSLSLASNIPNLTHTVLARTSDKSWQEKAPYDINPLERKVRPQAAVSGPFSVAVAVTGKFASFFSNKAGKEDAPDYLKDSAKVLKESPETRILVVSDSSLAQDELSNPDDTVFVTNVIDWLAQDSEMIKIRNRGLSEKPIAELQPTVRQILRYANVLGVPLLFILFGLGRWQWRKARLRNFKL